MSRIIDFDEEFNELSQRNLKIKNQLKETESIQNGNNLELNLMQQELDELLKQNKHHYNPIKKQQSSRTESGSWENEIFLKESAHSIEEKVRKEVYKRPDLLPKLSPIDWAIVGIAGAIAFLIDTILIRTPNGKMAFELLGKKIFDFEAYSESFHPTTFLKSLGLNEYGELKRVLKWLEKTCKVRYDKSVNPDIPGFTPKTHRLLNLGHDPLLGLIFSIFDTLNGSMTAIDKNGKWHVVKSFESNTSARVLSPLLWLGHLISDLCTKMGLPIPGWGMTQMLQFGSLGEKDRTIADVTRYMYLKGYDLRHFTAMSIVPATIEIIVRAYHLLSDHLSSKDSLLLPDTQTILSKELDTINLNIKLHKMLFFSHSIATSGNALKVFSSGGNPLALNLPQWIAFAKECHAVGEIATRHKETEMIRNNRMRIDEKWDFLYTN